MNPNVVMTVERRKTVGKNKHSRMEFQAMEWAGGWWCGGSGDQCFWDQSLSTFFESVCINKKWHCIHMWVCGETLFTSLVFGLVGFHQSLFFFFFLPQNYFRFHRGGLGGGTFPRKHHLSLPDLSNNRGIFFIPRNSKQKIGPEKLCGFCRYYSSLWRYCARRKATFIAARLSSSQY